MGTLHSAPADEKWLEQWWLALILAAMVGFASSFLDWTRIYGIQRETLVEKWALVPVRKGH
jgi:hypothetical protein